MDEDDGEQPEPNDGSASEHDAATVEQPPVDPSTADVPVLDTGASFLFPPFAASSDPASTGPPPPAWMPPVTPAGGFPPYPYPSPSGQVPPGGFPPPPLAGGGAGPGGPSWPPPYGPADSWYLPPPLGQQPPARRGRRGVVLLLVAALVAGGIGAGLGAAFTNPSGPSSNAFAPLGTLPTGSTPPTSGAFSTAAIAKLVSPAVVNIETVVATPAGQPEQQAAGTGMLVTSDGIILTNNHVVEDARTVSVAIPGRGTYAATVLGTAKIDDVALVKVNGLKGLPTISIGDSSGVAVGQPVVALGNALGLDGPPSTAPGYVAGVGETITANGDNPFAASNETLHGLIETNAQIQPGDSGGPLVNTKGQVIGMDTAAASGDTGSSLGFAIPINTARSIALDIEHHDANASKGIVIGLSPYLGVWLGQGAATANGLGFGLNGGLSLGNSGTCPTSGSVANRAANGVSILYVTADGPAATAGIAEGDVITSIAGHVTTSSNGLEGVVAALRPGQTVSIGYTDPCGTSHTTSLTVGGIPV